MNVGILYSRIRVEEKLLVQALEARGISYEMIDVRQRSFRSSGSERAGVNTMSFWNVA